jgi:hypothetical protein
MASIAPRFKLSRLLVEPLRGAAYTITGLIVWVAGATYCHSYQILTGEVPGPCSGSLTWSAIAVVPWFALFEWSKDAPGARATRRPLVLAALVLGIAAASIALEYFVNFCAGDVSDHLGLLFMRRLPGIGISVLLIHLAKARRWPALRSSERDEASADLKQLAPSIDWIAAADNYVELHIGTRVILRRMTMRAAERALAGAGFVRIHRRYLVNLSRVSARAGRNGDRSIRVGDMELPVGQSYANRLSRQP